MARNYWAVLNKCSADAIAAVNGTDAAFFNISNYPAGTTLRIKWTGVVGIGGSLNPQFYKASCDAVQTAASGNVTPGVMTTTVPASAKWLVVDGSMVADVNLTIL